MGVQRFEQAPSTEAQNVFKREGSSQRENRRLMKSLNASSRDIKPIIRRPGRRTRAKRSHVLTCTYTIFSVNYMEDVGL